MNDVIDRAPGPVASTSSPVRATTVAAVSVVAAVAAAVSFLHMHDLAARAGEGWRAWLVLLAVDGLVIAASMTMLLRRRAGNPAGWLVWASMSAGTTASLAANVAAAQPTLIGRAVAAWPPLGPAAGLRTADAAGPRRPQRRHPEADRPTVSRTRQRTGKPATSTHDGVHSALPACRHAGTRAATFTPRVRAGQRRQACPPRHDASQRP